MKACRSHARIGLAQAARNSCLLLFSRKSQWEEHDALSYTLSFWIGNIVDPGGTYGKTSTVEVSINGGPRIPFTNADETGATAMNRKQFTTSFTANSASTTIAFFNGDPGNDNSNGLDNIAILP
jgi:hypothetical protein